MKRNKKGVLMMSVLGNGGIGSIKKQIFLLLGLFFSFSHLGAMSCPQTVGFISIDQGIWNVLTRIGQATNVIESQLCALNSVAGSGCTFSFGQADIGAGNIYTISVPGTYCMSEDVTFSVGTAITIASSDVTIDMQGFTLNGANSASALAGIVLDNFISNVIIQNGTIENISNTVSAGAISDSDITNTGGNPTLVNITIQNINFNNNDISINVGFSNVTGNYTDGLLIENCNSFGTIASDINVFSISTIVRECQLQNIVEILPPLIVLEAVPYIVVEDCVISSTSTSQAGYLSVIADNVVIRNCLLQGPAYEGISVVASTVTISDCTVQGGDTSNYLNGINLTNNISGGTPGAPLSAIIERCFVANSGTGFYINFAGYALKLVDCVAENNAFDGFNIISITATTAMALERCSSQSNGLNGFVAQSGGGEGDIEGIVFTDCQAAANGVCGFLLLSTDYFASAVFDSCVAQVNGGDGFNLDNQSGAGNALSNISFNNCVSQGNIGGGVYEGAYSLANTTTYIGDGFGINSSIPSSGRAGYQAVNTVAFTNCVAQNNANDGFDFGAAAYSVDNISCYYCTAEQNGSHGMNFSSAATDCTVSQCLLMKNGGNGINNLNANFGPLPPTANSFLSNRSFNNAGVDYFQINDGVNGQPFYSRSTEASVQGASAWANIRS